MVAKRAQCACVLEATCPAVPQKRPAVFIPCPHEYIAMVSRPQVPSRVVPRVVLAHFGSARTCMPSKVSPLCQKAIQSVQIVFPVPP